METQTLTAEIVPQEPAQTALDKRAAIESSITQALEAQVRASVEIRYQKADARPRNLDMVWQRLKLDCQRPGFAVAALYARKQGSKLIGGKWVDNIITGPSIRFVEAAIRHMGNIAADSSLVMDDEHRRVVRVCVTDLETNACYHKDLVIAKTVERSSAHGREVMTMRTNSEGKPSYVVKATEEELVAKEGALVSKAIRTLCLRLIPADMVEDAIELCHATQHKKDATDPDAERKKVFDAFAGHGVSPDQIQAYFQRQVAPSDLPKLRAMFASIKAGETTWKELVSSEPGKADSQPAAAAQKLADKAKAAKTVTLQPAPNTKPPSTEQRHEARRLMDKLYEHNPELAKRLWDEWSKDYTESGYAALIGVLSDEVKSAEDPA